MISATMQDAINHQITLELASEHLYLSMSAYCAARSWDGFAHWFRMQAGEEHGHGMKFFDHVLDRGGHVVLETIEAPQTEFESLLDVMQLSLQHEQEVTAALNELYGKAVGENDYAAQALLQWFITEQVEEEKTVSTLVDQLRMIGGQGTGVLILDRELAGRTAEPAVE